MADASESTVADSVTLRMSWRRALMLGGAFNFGIFVVAALPRIVVRQDLSALLHAIGFFSVLTLLYSWPMRELFKVWGRRSVQLLDHLSKKTQPQHQRVCFCLSSARCSSASRSSASPRSTGSRLLLSAFTSSSRSCSDKASASSKTFFAPEVTQLA